MEEQLILSKIKLLPNELKQEIMDFIEFLLDKHGQKDKNENLPKFGSLKGVFTMSDDFDEPLSDFADYMK